MPELAEPEVPDGLLDESLTGELVTALREARRWNARVTGLVSLADKRGLARRQGYRSTTEWLMALSGEPAAACRTKIAMAEALEEMPQARAAFAAGDLSESRVRVLAQASRHSLGEVDFDGFGIRERSHPAVSPCESRGQVAHP